MNLHDIGAQIARLRKQRRMSQGELAELTGLSRAFISNLERGVASDVGIKRVMRILGIFGWEIDVVRTSGPPTLEDLEQELNDAGSLDGR